MVDIFCASGRGLVFFFLLFEDLFRHLALTITLQYRLGLIHTIFSVSSRVHIITKHYSSLVETLDGES